MDGTKGKGIDCQYKTFRGERERERERERESVLRLICRRVVVPFYLVTCSLISLLTTPYLRPLKGGQRVKGNKGK